MTPRQRLLDIQLPGGINSFVNDRRREEKSWDDIAADINRQLPNERPVNGNSLRRWYAAAEAVA